MNCFHNLDFLRNIALKNIYVRKNTKSMKIILQLLELHLQTGSGMSTPG